MLREFVFGQERRTESECKSLLKVRREGLAEG